MCVMFVGRKSVGDDVGLMNWGSGVVTGVGRKEWL